MVAGAYKFSIRDLQSAPGARTSLIVDPPDAASRRGRRVAEDYRRRPGLSSCLLQATDTCQEQQATVPAENTIDPLAEFAANSAPLQRHRDQFAMMVRRTATWRTAA